MNRTRFVSGGTTEATPKRLGWWERRQFSRALDDIVMKVNPRQATRPDLISYDIYGTAQLAWLVLQYNNIVDINTELAQGKTIYLPQKSRVMFNFLS